MEKPRAAAYVRVSTEDQVEVKTKDGRVEKKPSLGIQREVIEAHCRLKGWKLVHTYSDEGISGKRSDRPALFSLLEAAKRKDFEYVVCMELTRFGRTTLDILRNAETLRESGVIFVALKENLELADDNPYTGFFFTIMGAVAQLEHEMIKSRMRGGKLRKSRNKEVFIGKLPLGYIWNKEKKCIEVAEAGSKTYLHIVSQYLDLGKSARQIALDLHRSKTPSIRAKQWSDQAALSILKNATYLGTATVTLSSRDRNGEVTDSEQFACECPPLISQSRWDPLQERIDSGRRNRSGRPVVGAEHFLLYNMVKCGECGARMHPRHGHKRLDGSAPAYYACHISDRSAKTLEMLGRNKCELPMVPAGRIDGYLFNWLMKRLAGKRDEFTSPTLGLGRWGESIQAAKDKLDNLQASLKRQAVKLRNVDQLLLDPDIDTNEFKAIRNATKAEMQMLERQIEEATGELAHFEELKENEAKLQAFVASNGGALRESPRRIAKLPDAKKQKLLCGMLAGPVTVRKPTPWAKVGDGSMGDWLDFSFRFNPVILKEILHDTNSKNASKRSR